MLMWTWRAATVDVKPPPHKYLSFAFLILFILLVALTTRERAMVRLAKAVRWVNEYRCKHKWSISLEWLTLFLWGGFYSVFASRKFRSRPRFRVFIIGYLVLLHLACFVCLL